MRPRYYKLNGHEVVPCNDVIEWAKSFEYDNRHVALENVGPLRISTVFLGLDHSFGGGKLLIFETMVFDDNSDNQNRSLYMDRCSTWDEAEAMHKNAVAWAKLEMTMRTSCWIPRFEL